MMKIDQKNVEEYLKTKFSDRDHAQSKYVLEMINELSRENINNIEDLDNLIKKYLPDVYLFKMEHEMGIRLSDVGVIRSLLVAKKIDDINNIIEKWGPLPERPEKMQDPQPFVDMGRGIASYLLKSNNSIKISTTNEGQLDISFSELGDRIGTGLPYLRRLENRLEKFKEILLSQANPEISQPSGH